MRFAVVFVLVIAAVSAIDLRMCERNCRMNEHYCKYTGAPGQTSNFCMQKGNECKVGCIQMCKEKCNKDYSPNECITECQYRGQMMLQMNMEFNGPRCMDECMWEAQQCNRQCDDTFHRLGLHRPLMSYIYPEQKQADWTVMTGVMNDPNREPEPQFPSFANAYYRTRQ